MISSELHQDGTTHVTNNERMEGLSAGVLPQGGGVFSRVQTPDGTLTGLSDTRLPT